MKIQTNAVNILERTSSYLQAGLLKNVPAWYDVVASIPPTTKFAREPKLEKNPSTGMDKTILGPFSENVNKKGLYKTRYNTSDRKVSTNRLYRAPKLVYVEDKLRQLFYEQHPWELSRPKMVIENELETGYDWSHIQQLGRPLDGESVVQRSLFLVRNNECSNLVDAYNQARFEFYRVRMQQDMEEQVAEEEAEMFGSVFGVSALEYGVEREQKVIDQWKKRAIKETELLAARRANPSESWGSREGKNGELGERELEEEEDIEIEEIRL